MYAGAHARRYEMADLLKDRQARVKEARMELQRLISDVPPYLQDEMRRFADVVRRSPERKREFEQIMLAAIEFAAREKWAGEWYKVKYPPSPECPSAPDGTS